MRKTLLLWCLVAVWSAVGAQPVEFTAKKELPASGATQTVAISVKNFTSVTTTQFTLQWPSSVFQFTSVSDFGLPDLDPTHFNTTLAATGKLTFSWDDVSTNGYTAVDGRIIFKINFTVNGPVPPGAVLELTATPTPTEVTRTLNVASVVFNNLNLSSCCN